MSVRQTLVVVLVASAVLAGVTGVAVAQEAPPGNPAAFFGAVETVDGTAAPAGTTIFAVAVDANGETSTEGSFTIEAAGQYGGEGATDDKLRIDSNAGEQVRFHIGAADGPQSESTFALEAGVFEQDLRFPAGTFETVIRSTSVGADGFASIEFADPAAAAGVSAAEIELPDSIPDNAQVSVEAATTPTGDTPDVPDVGEVALYLDISLNADGETVAVRDPVTVDVDVTANALGDIASEDAAIAHFIDGSWDTRPTSAVGDDPVTLSASTTGLSPFAIVEPAAAETDGGSEAGSGGGGGGGASGGGGGGGGEAATETITATPVSTPVGGVTETAAPVDETAVPASETATAEPTVSDPRSVLSPVVIGLIAAAILLAVVLALRLR
jgi:hypothetical protein